MPVGPREHRRVRERAGTQEERPTDRRVLAGILDQALRDPQNRDREDEGTEPSTVAVRGGSLEEGTRYSSCRAARRDRPPRPRGRGHPGPDAQPVHPHPGRLVAARGGCILLRSMKVPLPADAQDLVSAALRHVRDAERLAVPGGDSSPDQAYHLAGLGPECARKATLSSKAFRKILGHDLGAQSDALLRFWTALDPVALRSEPFDMAARFPALANWRVDCRYERTGTRAEAPAAELVREAREHVDRVTSALWADGRLPAEVLQ